MASRPAGPVTMKFMVRDPAASSTPLADRAYAVIQDQLIMLDIPPHAAIVEGELAEQLGVGRTPVREALKRLEVERLVVSYPRRGTFATGVDVNRDDKKLQWAKDLGATHTVNVVQEDTVAAVRELTGGFGADIVIDAVGRPETWRQAFYARDLAGTVVLVGVPTPDMTVEMPLIDIFSRGGSLKSSWYGDCLPERDFPTLVDLYQQGRLPLEKFVTERIRIDDVEDAFHTMHAGEVLRSVVVL